MFVPGDRVTVDYRAGHSGVVLARNDPRAWEGSIAFPERPTVAQVDAHIANPHIAPFIGKDVPVAWSFGKVYWTEVGKLRRFEPCCRQGLCSGVVPDGKHDAECVSDWGG